MTEHATDTKDTQTSDGQGLGAALFGWTSRNGMGRLVLLGLAVFGGLLFALDFLVSRDGYSALEETPGFYAIYGALAFAVVALIAWPLRGLINRSETYYDEDGSDG